LFDNLDREENLAFRSSSYDFLLVGVLFSLRTSSYTHWT